ncbi:PAS domain-containing protein [Devosia chinhatensis]|uniref:Blue-light-activated histidine kinase n=1 Tax=Devosia chinhatensis TaxID=429727 RepID=A0A0F5FK54_9HYPH|nr:PAS domain-containing protein [Devosia chinhatensis]KKB08582.1 histidine kinase [Devosia chinhatensis]
MSEHDIRIEHELHNRLASNDPFASAVRATRMPMIITDPRQKDNPIVFANDAFGKLTGYSREEVLGRNCRFLQGPATNGEDVVRIRNAIARQESIEIDLLNYRKDGSTFWNRLLISPVFDESGELSYFFASQFDVSPERNRVSELQMSHSELESEIERRMLDLMANENRIRFILHAARMGIWTLDLSNDRLISSPQCKANFGRDTLDPFTYEDLKASFLEADRLRWQEVVSHAIETGEEFDIELRIRTPRHEVRWVQIRGQISRNLEEQPSMMSGVTLEISERKEADEHRKLLSRELNHRVKNMLATAQSVFTQSLRSASDLKEAQTIAVGRIQSLAIAQDLLTQEGWSSATLADVVERAMAPFNGSDLRIAGPRVLLGAKAVSTLSLAMHELATNAIKYGALSEPGGSVTITWELTGDDEKMLRFNWSEMGGPAVEPPTRRGFGTRVIEQMVAAELGGQTNLEFRSSGILYEIAAPLEKMIDNVDAYSGRATNGV